jgi:hypothetical protein
MQYVVELLIIASLAIAWRVYVHIQSMEKKRNLSIEYSELCAGQALVRKRWTMDVLVRHHSITPAICVLSDILYHFPISNSSSNTIYPTLRCDDCRRSLHCRWIPTATTEMPLRRRVISYLYMTCNYMIALDEIQSVKNKIWLQALRDNIET